MNRKYMFAVLALTALLLLEGSVYAVQLGSFGIGSGNGLEKNGGGCEAVGECAPKIDCSDPAQVGKDFCTDGMVISSCEDACVRVRDSTCKNWSANSVTQCKAQCTTINGCTKG